MDMTKYDSVMAGVKQTDRTPFVAHNVVGLLSRAEAEWLNRIPTALGVGTYVELGTFRGRSACLLGESVSKLPDSKLFTVDLFDQRALSSKYKSKDVNTHKEVIELLKTKGLDKHVEVIKADTITAASLFYPESIVFLFIDADHSYEGVKADFEAWEEIVKRDGIIAFHDSNQAQIMKFHSEIENWKEFDRVDTLSVWSHV